MQLLVQGIENNKVGHLWRKSCFAQIFCGFTPHCKSVVYDFGGSNPPPPTSCESTPNGVLFAFISSILFKKTFVLIFRDCPRKTPKIPGKSGKMGHFWVMGFALQYANLLAARR